MGGAVHDTRGKKEKGRSFLYLRMPATAWRGNATTRKLVGAEKERCGGGGMGIGGIPNPQCKFYENLKLIKMKTKKGSKGRKRNGRRKRKK